MAVDSNKLSREFLQERDARIFSLKKSGLSNQDIAKRFDMTAAAVAAATRRQLGRLNSEAWLSYPEVLRLELELLGMNVERTEVAISGLEQREVVDVQSSLVGGRQEIVIDNSKDEALQLLELMSSSGVLDSKVVSEILDNIDEEEEVDDVD